MATLEENHKLRRDLALQKAIERVALTGTGVVLVGALIITL